jgi:hypothetical protein
MLLCWMALVQRAAVMVACALSHHRGRMLLLLLLHLLLLLLPLLLLPLLLQHCDAQ